MPAFKSEDDTSTVAFVLNRNDTVHAIDGDLYIVHLGKVMVRDSTYVFVPGDTVFTLGCSGEEDYEVWHAGKLMTVPIFWSGHPSETSRSESPTKTRKFKHYSGIMLEEPRAIWWVEVKTASGQLGWVRLINTDSMCWDFEPRFDGWDRLD
jgi:hypothetical protein